MPNWCEVGELDWYHVACCTPAFGSAMMRFSRLQVGAGALCAASGLTLYASMAYGGASAHCDASQQRPEAATASAAAATAASRAADLVALADWLRQQGADIDAIQFKQSDKVCVDICGATSVDQLLDCMHRQPLVDPARPPTTTHPALHCICRMRGGMACMPPTASASAQHAAVGAPWPAGPAWACRAAAATSPWRPFLSQAP